MSEVKRVEVAWSLPATSPIFWIVAVVLFALTPGWYFPKDTYKPLILGIPGWAFCSILATAGLGIFAMWAVYNLWKPLGKVKDHE